MSNSLENKRVAKNSILLYGRMLLMLVISLYTSRVILEALGFNDYGIYNVVGGIVTMFTFINSAMGNASSRFITFAIGKGEKDNIIDVFNSSLLVHVTISILIIILSETIGLWLLYNKLVIPPDRFTAACWVYQLSVISCVANIMCVPFNATIIAHEKMGAFAYISLIDAVLKLIIAYSITIVSGDRLVVYAILLFGVQLTNILIYQIYCIRNFDIIKLRKLTDYRIMHEMSKFAGWSLIGNLAYIGYTQGLNILLNIFFGPVVNAARGIAVQVQNAVRGFVTNFQMAINPQITKSYAKNNYGRLHELIFASSKFSFFLLLCFVLPISIESNNILHLWLGNVPQYSAQFLVLTLSVLLIDCLANPLGIANNATGNIRNYQLVEGGMLLLIVPIAYIGLKLGGNPDTVFVVQLLVMIIVQTLRIFLVCHKIRMSRKLYMKNVILRVFTVGGASIVIPMLIYNMVTIEDAIVSILIITVFSWISIFTFTYILGLNSNEREFINSKTKIILKRIIR